MTDEYKFDLKKSHGHRYDEPMFDEKAFDEVIDRRGSGSYKWDDPADGPDMIELWVADMDFRAAPPILDALRRRVEHGVFGYTRVPDEFYAATVDWFRLRHGWTIDPERIIYTSGVVPAISAIIKALAHPGEKVAVMTPVYNCFFSSIRNNGCLMADAPLSLAGNRYDIDFDRLEATLADPDVKLLLLCNPHNPAGRVWTREELLRVDALCRANNVIVISDEIHCEIVFNGHDYTPFASLGAEAAANCVSCISPSKAFNIAGLQIAEIVCPDPETQARIDRAININEVCDVNPFGVTALIAAYRHGEPWLEALLRYLQGNYEMLCDFFAARLPQMKVIDLEGTYLAWVDCRATGMSGDEIEAIGRRNGVRVASGAIYGDGNFIRINMATSRSRLLTGLERVAASGITAG